MPVIGEKKTFPNGNTGVWDGIGWAAEAQTAPSVGTRKTFANGNVGEWDGKGWAAVSEAPKPEKSFGEQVKEGLGLQIGFAKGAGDTVLEAGKLMSKIPIGWSGQNLGDAVEKMGAAPEYAHFEETPELLKPKGALQHVGFGGEKVVEALIPATKAAQLGKAKQLGTVGRTLLQGATGGSTAAVQTGGDPAATAAGALTSAGFEAGAAGVRKVAGFTADKLKSWAVNQYAKAFRPVEASDKALAKQIAPEMIKRGEMHATKGALQDKASTRVEQLRTALEDAWANLKPGESFDPKPLFKEIDDAINSFNVAGTKQPLDKFAAQAQAELGQLKMELYGLTKLVKGGGRELEYTRLQSLKKYFDKLVDERGGHKVLSSLSDRTDAGIRDTLADIYRKYINEGLPNIGQMNKEIHFWLDVKELMDKATRHDLKGTISSGAAGAAYGFATSKGGVGNRVKGAATYGLLAGGLRGLMGSTGWRTVSAVSKDRLAQAIESGSRENVYRAIQAASQEIAQNRAKKKDSKITDSE